MSPPMYYLYMSFSGSSAASSLHALPDVALSNPADTQILSYNATTQKWTNVSAASSAITMADKGTWSASATYVAGNIVTYSGSRYISVAGAPANSYFDTSKWILLGSVPDTF